jgi:deoxycytidine triphosphate deaminase
MSRREKGKKLLEQLKCFEQDPLRTTGVLLSDEIEEYVKQFKLIDPFDPNNLKPAAYELTVGDEYSLGGKTGKLSDESGKNEVKIPPFEVIVIKTRERLNLPRFLIARWNIRVKWAYEGLLWVGGPQVDPGWVGHLCCPIYNLSDHEVTLRLGEPIAVMRARKD